MVHRRPESSLTTLQSNLGEPDVCGLPIQFMLGLFIWYSPEIPVLFPVLRPLMYNDNNKADQRDARGRRKRT